MKAQQILAGIGVILVLGACTAGNTQTGSTSSTGSQTNSGETLTTNTEVPMVKYEAPAVENGDIVATIKTNNGTMKIKLFTNIVPMTTTNFIALSKQGYYDNVVFHRVIPDFMIQGGDPEGTGVGGTSIYGDKFEDEFDPELKNVRGTISMANAGPNTNGSQFFINVKDNNFLDNIHSVFGEVVEGIDVADKISKAKADGQDKPISEIKMISVVIEEYQDGKYIEYPFNLDEALQEVEGAKAEADAQEEIEKTAQREANKDRVVVETDTVSVHYKGTLEDGSTFDSSYDRNAPIDVALDQGQVIPGFGNAIIGMKIGDKKSVTLAPADAYGEYDATNTQEFPLADLTAQGISPVVGETVPSAVGELKVVALTEDTVTLDVNHPLASKTLNFDLELVDFVN